MTAPARPDCGHPDSYCPTCEVGNDCSVLPLPVGFDLADPDLSPARLPRVRVWQLDALRGLAMVLMLVDHVALLTGEPTVRQTLGRVAMPLFFLLGGHLARGPSRRLVPVLLVGLGLQVLAPWAGAGPLLLTFVCGAVLVAWAPRHTCWLFVAVSLGMLANGAGDVPGGYPVPALLGLMALGRLVDRDQLVKLGNLLRRVRPVLVPLGRWPLTFYAGHVLALTVLFHPYG